MTTVTCSCCGAVPDDGVVRLQTHRDIAICYDCLDWLNARRRKQVAARGGGPPSRATSPRSAWPLGESGHRMSAGAATVGPCG
jgi:hypothetical protein